MQKQIAWITSKNNLLLSFVWMRATASQAKLLPSPIQYFLGGNECSVANDGQGITFVLQVSIKG